MSHEIVWLVDKRVLVTTFSGVVTMEEVETFTIEIQKMIAEEGEPKVHHISDSRGMERVQFSMAALRVMSQAGKMMKSLGWQVDVNTNVMNKMFANFGAQFAGLNTRTFPTMEEAITFLKRADITLADAEWRFDRLPGHDDEAALTP